MSKAIKYRVSLREKNVLELREELTSLHREHFSLRMQKSVQQNANTAQMRRARRDIARAKTILAQKERSAHE